MKKLTEKLLRKVAMFSRKAAIKAAGAASVCNCHQPKEPSALKRKTKINSPNET